MSNAPAFVDFAVFVLVYNVSSVRARYDTTLSLMLLGNCIYKFVFSIVFLFFVTIKFTVNYSDSLFCRVIFDPVYDAMGSFRVDRAFDSYTEEAMFSSLHLSVNTT